MIEFSSALLGLTASLGISILGVEIGLWLTQRLASRLLDWIGGLWARRVYSSRQRCR